MKKLILTILLSIVICSLNSCGTIDSTLYVTDYTPQPTVIYYKPYSYYGTGVGFLHRYPPYPTYYKQIPPPKKPNNKHHHNDRKGTGRPHRH